jgi:hypothetical protein
MEKVENVSELIVGKFYLVPCLKQWCNGKWRLMPVVNLEHQDHFAPNAGMHYHYDTRFFKDAFFTNGIAQKGTDELVYKRKKCYRLEGGVDLDWIAKFKKDFPKHEGGVSKFVEWYNSMQGKDVPIIEGKPICPHKGAVMTKVGNEFVCPMHRLRACATLKKINGSI